MQSARRFWLHTNAPCLEHTHTRKPNRPLPRHVANLVGPFFCLIGSWECYRDFKECIDKYTGTAPSNSRRLIIKKARLADPVDRVPAIAPLATRVRVSAIVPGCDWPFTKSARDSP